MANAPAPTASSRIRRDYDNRTVHNNKTSQK
jgi:hypothetical protein